ncbi:MAG: glycosyltransferase [Defluviicoccus sp.]|nr:MAG: glycosyltransferase [Defluviicoccus sp.]
MGLSARGHDIALLLEDQRGWLIDELRSSCPEATIVNLRASDVSWLSQRLYQARAFVSMMIDNAITASRDWCIRPLFDLIFSDNAPIAALCQYIKAQQPDVIISFLNSPNAVLLVTSRVDRRRTRKVVSVHNTISVVANKNASKRNQVMPRLMRRLFPFADAIVAPSSGVAEDLAKVSGLNSEKYR